MGGTVGGRSTRWGGASGVWGHRGGDSGRGQEGRGAGRGRGDGRSQEGVAPGGGGAPPRAAGICRSSPAAPGGVGAGVALGARAAGEAHGRP